MVIAAVVTVAATALAYAKESPFFADPVRSAPARRNFTVEALVLAVLGTTAASVIWMRWRGRAALDRQPDGPARLLAVATAALPAARRHWGDALQAELAAIGDRPHRWRFACGGTYATLRSPSWREPAAGRIGAALGTLGVVAAVAALLPSLAGEHMTRPATPVALAGVLTLCLALLIAAPPALTSSRLARRSGATAGLATGVLLLAGSRMGALHSGALPVIVPVGLAGYVLLPAMLASFTRSLRPALQGALWTFVFATVSVVPVYLVESSRHLAFGNGLFLDSEPPGSAAAAANLADAVYWVTLLLPGVLLSLGVIAAAVLAGRSTGPVASALLPADAGRTGGPDSAVQSSVP